MDGQYEDLEAVHRDWLAIHTEILAHRKEMIDDTIDDVVPKKLISRPSGTNLLQDQVFLLTNE